MAMPALKIACLPKVVRRLYKPDIHQVAQVLQSSLYDNFRGVRAQVVMCPDLRNEPYNLAAKGLGGRAKIVDIGGTAYMYPFIKKHKIYDLKEICTNLGRDNVSLLGGGYGKFINGWMLTQNIINAHLATSETWQKSVQMMVVGSPCCIGQSSYQAQELCEDDTTVSLMANFLMTSAIPEPVIMVACSERIGQHSFTEAIQNALKCYYADATVGVGGMYMLLNGAARAQLIPTRQSGPIQNQSEADKWQLYFNVNAPLVCVGTLTTSRMGLHGRSNDFHCFSNHGDGGLFHIDTTPKDSFYLGYFTMAESVVRIDAPVRPSPIWHGLQ